MQCLYCPPGDPVWRVLAVQVVRDVDSDIINFRNRQQKGLVHQWGGGKEGGEGEGGRYLAPGMDCGRQEASSSPSNLQRWALLS